MTDLLNLHRRQFPPVSRPVAPPAPPLDEAAIRRRHRSEALKDVGIFDRRGRAEARQRADLAAGQEIAGARAEADPVRVQAQLDEHWQALCSNDPATVLATLHDAFEDNEVPSAAVGVTGDQVGVVVLVPGEEVLPERLPGVSGSGNLTMPKMSQTDQAALYRAMVCGHLLATVREVLAVAPGITAVRAAAIRLGVADAYGHRRHECLLAALVPRRALDGIAWDQSDAATIVDQASTELLCNPVGRTKRLTALDVSSEPDLRAMLDAVVFDPAL